MKHTNMYYKLISSVFAVLCLVSLFSCKLNAEAENNQGITQPVEKAILTGPCGETADTSDDVVEINGNRYYTLKSNYEKDYYPVEDLYGNITNQEDVNNKPFTDETSETFHKIRVMYWEKWLYETPYWRNTLLSELDTRKEIFIDKKFMTEGYTAYQDVFIYESDRSYFKNPTPLGVKKFVNYISEKSFLLGTNELFVQLID